MHIPEGADQLADQAVADRTEEAGVERAVLVEEVLPALGLGDHVGHQGVELGVGVVLSGGHHAFGHRQIQRQAHFDDLPQRLQDPSGDSTPRNTRASTIGSSDIGPTYVPWP